MSTKKSFVRPDSASHRPDDTYKKVLDSIANQGLCPFCPENLLDNHKNPILLNGKSWIVTENMYPYPGSNVHLLAIHRDHIEHPIDMKPDAWEELRRILTGDTVVNALVGGTFLMRFGDTRFNGASVTHLHAQLVAGKGKPNSDPVMTRVG